MGRVDGGVLQTCKPGFVSFRLRKDGDHLSSPSDGGEASRSPLLAERRCRRSQAANPGTGQAPMSPYLALLQVGFSRRCVTADGRTLLPSDFTLASTSRGGMFLCHFPSPNGTPMESGPSPEAWELPSTMPRGARTFLPHDESRRRSPSLHYPPIRTLA